MLIWIPAKYKKNFNHIWKWPGFCVSLEVIYIPVGWERTTTLERESWSWSSFRFCFFFLQQQTGDIIFEQEGKSKAIGGWSGRVQTLCLIMGFFENYSLQESKWKQFACDLPLHSKWHHNYRIWSLNE